MAKILIIEDERSLSRFLELELRHEGYEIFIQENGKKGLQLALELDWDLILLDLMLPEMNGMEVCRRIRQEKETPIMMMTARNTTMDLVMGLDQGADDYIFKPFAIEELLARVRSLLRRADYYPKLKKKRAATKEDGIFQIRDLRIDLKTRTAYRNDEQLPLTKKEFDTLEYFFRHRGEILSRVKIAREVWGDQEDSNVVEVYIRYLRQKIDVADEPSYITTIRGRGYLMEDSDGV